MIEQSYTVHIYIYSLLVRFLSGIPLLNSEVQFIGKAKPRSLVIHREGVNIILSRSFLPPECNLGMSFVHPMGFFFIIYLQCDASGPFSSVFTSWIDCLSTICHFRWLLCSMNLTLFLHTSYKPS